MSGFVVNLARHEVKLTTPVWSSKEHPTGEAILEVGNFTDAEEFRELLLGMIKRHMQNLIEPDDEITLEDGLSLEVTETEVIFRSDKGLILRMETKGKPDMFVKLYDILKDGYALKRDIVAKLCVTEDGALIPAELIYYVINKWWGLGIIKTKSGKL